MTAVPETETAPRPSLRFLLAVMLMGATALIAQVVLTRELLALFLGNELSIALVLAVWLVAVAGGSAAGARLAPRVANPERAFARAQVLAAALSPICLLIARRVQPGEMIPGEALGPGSMLVASLETLALVCLVAGLQFVLAARAATEAAAQGGRASARAVSPVAVVYALEAAGAVAGGAVFHFYLAESVAPFRTFGALGLLNVASAVALLRPRVTLGGAAALAPALALGLALVGLTVGAGRAEMASLRGSPQWSDMNVVDSAPSRYGALVVTERAGQVSFFQSGVLVFTSQDEYWNEVAAHLPLLEHPDPRRVLLIGGAASGVPGEMLKHPVAALDCVELDPRLVELARRWLPRALLEPLSNRRVALHHGDGRLFVKEAQGEYDVIVVNVPDPTTAALNRFYTAGFFGEARRALAPGGLLAITLTGSPHHLSGSVLRAAATTYWTLSSVFPDVLVVPGEQMFFLAADQDGVLASDWRVLAARRRRRDVESDFVNEAWLQDALLPFRADMMRQSLTEERVARLNTDLYPVGYYQQTRIWLDQLSPWLARPAGLLARASWWWAGGAVVLAVLAVALTRGRSRRLAGAAILIATAVIGGFELVVEVVALLVFQSACGYVYHALGALIAAFMAGLALGAAAMSRRTADRAGFGRLLAAGLAAAALFSVLLPGLFRSVLSAAALAPLALGLVLLLAGSLGGAIFPVATALYRREREAASAGGAIYAADLVGSAGAAAAAGAVAIPLLGVTGICWAGGLVVVGALILALPLTRGGPGAGLRSP